MEIKNKSVLVTGGAGFIGSHLVDELTKENLDNLVVIDNLYLGKESNLNDAKLNYPNLKFYKEDVSDYGIMKKIFENENIDIVFDLAVIPLPASLLGPQSI